MDSEAWPFRFGQKIWKISLDIQKHFPNQIVYVKFAQFWALAHLPNSGQRNCAAVPECQASVGSQSAAERSLENPRAQALLANSFMDLGP